MAGHGLTYTNVIVTCLTVGHSIFVWLLCQHGQEECVFSNRAMYGLTGVLCGMKHLTHRTCYDLPMHG
jgi:hypothetical protein